MNTTDITRRALTTIGLAAAAGFLSVAPSYAEVPVPSDQGQAESSFVSTTGTVSDDGLEALQITLGALGGVAATAAVAGAVSRSHRRHAAMPA